MNWMASTVVESVRAVFVRVGDALPVLVGAIIILVAGWGIAGVAQKGVVRLLKAVRLDDLSDKARITEFLGRGEIRLTLSELIGVFLYWLLVLAFALASLNALGLTVADSVAVALSVGVAVAVSEGVALELLVADGVAVRVTVKVRVRVRVGLMVGVVPQMEDLRTR